MVCDDFNEPILFPGRLTGADPEKKLTVDNLKF